MMKLCMVCFVAGTALAQGCAFELNRVFLASNHEVFAVELDGTIAWIAPFENPANFDGIPAGLCVDGHGYLWLAAGANGYWGTSPSRIQKFTVSGQSVFTVPFSGPSWSYVASPAVDRDGNCYIRRLVANANAPYGYQSHLVKLDPSGGILWNLDLSPQLALSNPPVGVITDVQVDEDGCIWAAMGDVWNVYVGGRLLRIDPSGNVLVSVQAGGPTVQLTPDRKVRAVRTQGSTGCAACVTEYDFSGNVLTVYYTSLPLWPHEQLSHASGRWYSKDLNGQGFYGLPQSVPSPPSLGYMPLHTSEGAFYTPLAGGENHLYVAFDTEGHLWTFSAHGTSLGGPSWAIRYDPPVLLSAQAGSYLYTASHVTPIGAPSTAALPRAYNAGRNWTAYNWCLFVDPWGDLDGDGVMNRNEILEGTNPCDPGSAGIAVAVTGLRVGRSERIDLSAPPQAGHAYATVMSGMPDLVRTSDQRGLGPDPGGWLAQWWLGPANGLATGVAGVLDGSGMAQINLQVPNDPALVGIPLWLGVATGDATWSLGLRTLHGPTRHVISAGP